MQKITKASRLIRTIKRSNGMWIAFMDGCKELAQARDKATAKLLFELGIYNIKD